MALLTPENFYVEALIELCPNIPIGIQEHGNLETLSFPDGEPDNKPTDAQIIAKATEIRDAFSMKKLREVRDELLAETDWMAVGDRTMSQAEVDYRQALRDLPANSPNVEYHSDGTWQNVTWPTKP